MALGTVALVMASGSTPAFAQQVPPSVTTPQAPDAAQAPPLDNSLLPAEPAPDEPVAPENDELSSKTAEPDPDWAPTENPNAAVVPGEMRSDREEIPAGATKEMADQAETMEARQRMSRAAVGCQTYWPFPYEVCGVIRDKYNSLGGPASFLSYPNSPEYTNPDGFGKRTQFLNGPIYWSAATGAHPVVNSFLFRWGQNGYEGGRLKYPTTDEIVLPDGGRRQEFQQGVIYVAFQNAVGSALMNGPVRDKYNSVGGLTPGGSLLGYPIDDQRALPDGLGQMARFQFGVIYWHPTAGAHFIRSGPILDYWSSQGYESGSFGYPITDEVIQNDIGFDYPTQAFQRDSIELFKEVDGDIDIGRQTYYTPEAFERKSQNRIAYYETRVNFSDTNYPLGFVFQLIPKLQAKGAAGPATLMTCKTWKLDDGVVDKGYHDNHPNIPMDYLLHSTARNPDPEGKNYQLSTSCASRNRQGGLMLIEYIHGYSITP